MKQPEGGVHVVAYASERRRQWDDFVRAAKNGHFMFVRDYMDYHADRFPDASLMFYDESDRLIGLLPATARDGVVSSHAGLSFGGVVSDASMKAELMLRLCKNRDEPSYAKWLPPLINGRFLSIILHQLEALSLIHI